MAKTGELNERLMSHYTVRAWKLNLCPMTRRSRVESLRQVKLDLVYRQPLHPQLRASHATHHTPHKMYLQYSRQSLASVAKSWPYMDRKLLSRVRIVTGSTP